MPQIDLSVRVRGPVTAKKILTIINYILSKTGNKKNSLEVELVSDNEIKKLNIKYRAKHKATDVLSFVWENSDFIGPVNYLGTMALAPKYIKQQAKRWGRTYQEEFIRSLAHGTLHLLGFDHISKRDAKKMYALQETVVKKFNE